MTTFATLLLWLNMHEEKIYNMKKQTKRTFRWVNERIEELQTDLESLQSTIDENDRESKDKLVWAKAKVNDLIRLLNSIK